MIEIGPNLKDLILVGTAIVAGAWIMVTAFRNM